MSKSFKNVRSTACCRQSFLSTVTGKAASFAAIAEMLHRQDPSSRDRTSEATVAGKAAALVHSVSKSCERARFGASLCRQLKFESQRQFETFKAQFSLLQRVRGDCSPMKDDTGACSPRAQYAAVATQHHIDDERLISNFKDAVGSKSAALAAHLSHSSKPYEGNGRLLPCML